ncbi:Ribokinase-like protein [Nemania serpens]|nr:Ribokinase-like protein [Nemania serpens]
MDPEPPVPETSVLAVASHVVSGHVGNKIAVFVLQSLGCDAAALNTVQFSNHTGYRRVKGTKLTAQEITDLWDGLKQSHLDDFDMMLSGYVPGAAGVEAVGRIGRELKANAASNPGSFFWVLDPVMGDNGKIYVAEDVVPAYQSLIHHADLILPNQFEAELLSGVKITDPASLERAIEVLHDTYNLPHIVITSVSLPLRSASQTPSSTRPASPIQSQAPQTPTMSVVGSTRTSDRKPRLFTIQFPVFNAYFSGTGDMFAALMVVRMREAVAYPTATAAAAAAAADDVRHAASWLSPDHVAPTDLPLARAAEKVLASMHEVLARTCEQMPSDLAAAVARLANRRGVSEDAVRADGETMHLLKSHAAELKLARNLACLREPTIQYRAERIIR